MPGSANAMAFAAGNTHQDMRLADTTLAQLREKIVAGRSSEQAPTPLCDKRSVPVDRGARSIAIPQILISHVPNLENIGHMFECITVKLPASSGSQEYFVEDCYRQLRLPTPAEVLLSFYRSCAKLC